jgi:hypothetical protein
MRSYSLVRDLDRSAHRQNRPNGADAPAKGRHVTPGEVADWELKVPKQ